MPKSITVHAEVDRKTKLALQEKAKAARVSTSVIVRWALDAYLASQDTNKSPEQEALRAKSSTVAAWDSCQGVKV